MGWIIPVTSQTCQEFAHVLTPLFPPANASTFLLPLQQNSSKDLCALIVSTSPPPSLSLDPTPVSLPCPSSKAVPVRVIDDVHTVKVIVQVSVLIQLDPSVALDIANDFLETLCSLGFQDITLPWVSSYQKETYWPLLLCSSTKWPLNVGGSSVSTFGPLASVSLPSLLWDLMTTISPPHSWLRPQECMPPAL